MKVCDCGQRYATDEALADCQVRGHAGSARQEALDALYSTPVAERDEAWEAAVAQAGALR